MAKQKRSLHAPVPTTDQHEERIQGVLRAAITNHGWEPIYDRTPLDELMEREAEVELSRELADQPYGWPSNSRPEVEIEALKRSEAAAVAAWARRSLMHWLAGDGMHPFKVQQRFHAMCFARYQELIGPLDGTDFAEIMGQGKGAFSAMMERLFGGPVKAATGVRMIVPGQKSDASRAGYAENARRNKPRQQLNGNTAALSEDARRAAAERLLQRRKKLRQLQREADEQDRLTRPDWSSKHDKTNLKKRTKS